MRHEAAVLSVSWIPSEAVQGMTKMPFEVGVMHYDDPPPDRISGPEELEALRAGRRFRFANQLRAWVDRGPMAWTTLTLTINADGSAHHELAGASAFPRHWVYDRSRNLTHRSGLMDFKDWYRHAFGRHSPWGDEDSPAVMSAVETALERELSAGLMRGAARPNVQRVKEGATVGEQGEPGGELFLLLDGLLAVEVDGEAVAEVGPGAVLGERAVLEGGRRTATLRAATACRVAMAPADSVDEEALALLSEGHRREEAPPG